MIDFLAYTEEFLERFKSTGPGLPTIELPAGLALLKTFQAEFEAASRSRENLVLAEKLFDMPITSYPMLSQVEFDLKKLAQVYAVYAEQADAVRQYGQLLWSELDVSKMVVGTEGVLAKLRTLKHLKLLPVYELVEKDVQASD